MDLGFPTAVRSYFGYLKELGFREVEARTTYVRFRRDDLFVEIYHGRRSYEIGAEIGRMLELQGKPVEQKFHAHDILERPDDYQVMTAKTKDQVDRFVGELAQRLQLFVVRLIAQPEAILAQASREVERRSDAYLDGIQAQRLRKIADDAWRRGDLTKAVTAYEEIESELKSVRLSQSETRRLAYARARIDQQGD